MWEKTNLLLFTIFAQLLEKSFFGSKFGAFYRLWLGWPQLSIGTRQECWRSAFGSPATGIMLNFDQVQVYHIQNIFPWTLWLLYLTALESFTTNRRKSYFKV